MEVVGSNGLTDNSARGLATNWVAARANPRTVGISAFARRQARVVAGSNCRVGSRHTKLIPNTSARAISTFAVWNIYYHFTVPAGRIHPKYPEFLTTHVSVVIHAVGQSGRTNSLTYPAYQLLDSCGCVLYSGACEFVKVDKYEIIVSGKMADSLSCAIASAVNLDPRQKRLDRIDLPQRQVLSQPRIPSPGSIF